MGKPSLQETSTLSRRKLLTLGGAGSAFLLAGCSGPGGVELDMDSDVGSITIENAWFKLLDDGTIQFALLGNTAAGYLTAALPSEFITDSSVDLDWFEQSTVTADEIKQLGEQTGTDANIDTMAKKLPSGENRVAGPSDIDGVVTGIYQTIASTTGEFEDIEGQRRWKLPEISIPLPVNDDSPNTVQIQLPDGHILTSPYKPPDVGGLDEEFIREYNPGDNSADDSFIYNWTKMNFDSMKYSYEYAQQPDENSSSHRFDSPLAKDQLDKNDEGDTVLVNEISVTEHPLFPMLKSIWASNRIFYGSINNEFRGVREVANDTAGSLTDVVVESMGWISPLPVAEDTQQIIKASGKQYATLGLQAKIASGNGLKAAKMVGPVGTALDIITDLDDVAQITEELSSNADEFVTALETYAMREGAIPYFYWYLENVAIPSLAVHHDEETFAAYSHLHHEITDNIWTETNFSTANQPPSEPGASIYRAVENRAETLGSGLGDISALEP